MSSHVPTELRLTQLNRDIEELQSKSAQIKKERVPLQREAALATIRLSYLRFVRWLRSPAASYKWWPTSVLLIGPMVAGLLVFLSIDLLSESFPYAILGLIIGLAAVFGILLVSMHRPANAVLPTAVTEAQAKSQMAHAHLKEKDAVDGLTDIKKTLRELLNERRTQTKQLRRVRRELIKKLRDARREQIAAGILQRTALLQCNWKAMRSDEWEGYLAEVFRAIGAKVERTGKCGDQGCDLIVEYRQERIAVQAKGYFNVVGNKAVQEAYASAAHWGCTACAVITNSRFTPKAKELAESTDCVLIGEDEFPDFVMGKIDISGQRE